VLLNKNKPRLPAPATGAGARFAGIGAMMLVLILAYSFTGRHGSPTARIENQGPTIAATAQWPAASQENAALR
jgi:hypothetical protein